MSSLIEGLPHDVALRCLAFVPFYLHPTLELVCRSWRAVISSGEILEFDRSMVRRKIFYLYAVMMKKINGSFMTLLKTSGSPSLNFQGEESIILELSPLFKSCLFLVVS